MYDWKERQPRVDHMLKSLRKRDPEDVLTSYPRHTKEGERYEHKVTAGQAIKDIEEGTLDGKSLVATYGMVTYARAATPEFFEKKGASKQ